MTGYIPPHERSDKSPPNPESNPDMLNITVRKSSLGAIPKIPIILEDIDLDQTANDSGTDPPHPAIMAMFKTLNDKMTEQITRLKNIDIAAVNTNKSLQFTQDSLNELKGKVNDLEKENKELASQNESYHRMTRDMGRRLDLMEQRLDQSDHTSRRKNIIIEGVAETQGENVVDIAIDILSTILPHITRNDLEFAQRVFKPGGKRPILITFRSVTLRDESLRKKKELKTKTNLKSIWLNEDANPTIKKQKNDCRNIVPEAQKQGLQAKQRGTGVVVNDTYYPYNRLDNLPANVKLAQTRTRVSDRAVGFAGPLAPLSNMHRSPYTKDGQGYKTVEQGHGHSKAKYAGDTKSAQAILDTDCAFTAHSIAKAIHAPGWDNFALPNLKEHMKEKYLQNDDCMRELLNTGTKKLLELTWDKKWAVGYGINSKLFHTEVQPGQNLTGIALEELRTEFRPIMNIGAVAPSSPTLATELATITHTPLARRDPKSERIIRTSPVTEV